MQPEALVASTLAVSQEQKSFRTNHTSILKIVNAAILKISMGQTNTHTHCYGSRFFCVCDTHTKNDYHNPRCTCVPRVNEKH